MMVRNVLMDGGVLEILNVRKDLERVKFANQEVGMDVMRIVF